MALTKKVVQLFYSNNTNKTLKILQDIREGTKTTTFVFQKLTLDLRDSISCVKGFKNKHTKDKFLKIH